MMNKNIKLKMLVMDVDGTLTDGKIYYGNDGEMFKAFNVRDGYRLIKCEEYGIVTAIITGKTSKIVDGRAKELKIKEVYQGIHNKIEILNMLVKKYELTFDEVAYIGDDVNDIDCMNICGFSACPADAMEEVKSVVDYVCKNNGGNGAVRELIDLIV
ncbi:MAG: HAD-IIIA family hydrolase [Ruminococcus sp.]|nr:HAD-IIIA family hydrolase [Ruminococcus sp.]